MLESIFTKLLILSVQAGFLIMATILIRGIFKKIPRKYICLLWCMAALRLLIPVTIESPVSLVPTESTIQEAFAEEPMDDYRWQRAEAMLQADAPSMSVENAATEYVEDTVMEAVNMTAPAGTNDNIVTSYTYEPEKKAPDLRMLMIYLWLFGVVILLGYGVFTYIRVRRKVRDAVHHEGNVWLSDRIDTPFLLGYVKPRIYMPFFVDESRREYIIAHEMGHIRRGDHITKLVGYILLAVYWFQPLVWIAYVLFCKDVEMACDEKVIGNLGEEKKKAYSQTLLLCSVDKHYLLANPLAFGEIDVKKRITNVLSYRKPGVIISIISVVVLVIAAVCFMTSRQEKQLSDTSLTESQEKYLETCSDGTRYAIVPMKGVEEPMLLVTNDDWEKPVFEGETDRITMRYYIMEQMGTIGATGSAYPVRWDEDGLYLMDEHHLVQVYVGEEISTISGYPYLKWATYEKEDDDYEKMLGKYEKAALVEFSHVVENIPAENEVFTEAQGLFIQQLDGNARLASLPLAGATEPLLLATEGVYEDPAFDNAEVSFFATYCMFGEEGSINAGGTAYPIRADYEAVYLESGHSITVLSIAEDDGEQYLESIVYSENDKSYPEILERCNKAPVVEFNIHISRGDAAVTEMQKQLSEELEAIEGMEVETLHQKLAMAEVAEQIKAQLEALEGEFGELSSLQKAQADFEDKYGAPVQMEPANSPEMAENIAIKMFTEYMKMDNLYSTSLPGESSYLGGEYWQVDMEMLSSAEAVYDHIRSVSTEEMAKGLYNSLFGGEYPLLKEENGKLYTAAFDGFPTPYVLYTEVTLHSVYEDEIIYTIAPGQTSEEEEMTSFFVRCVKEGYNWVVAEYAPVMTQGSHDYYPESVYSEVDMGEYQVVLQDYTTLPGGPLEVAILRDGEKETLSLLYEEWQRDPGTVRLADVGEIFGYDCFYVFDFGLFHTVVTDFYAMVDGEIQQVAGSWGDDPEKSTFIRDLDGDGRNELICNLTYSADGGQCVRIYKRDGDMILYDYDGAESFVGVDDGYESYANSHYDAESGKIVVCGYKDGEVQDIPWEIDMSVLEFGKYTPGY